MENTTAPPQILRLPKVIELTGLKRATIYDKLNKNSPRHDPSFPKQIRLSACIGGSSAVGFLAHEVKEWLEGRIAASRRTSSVPNARSRPSAE